MATMKRKSLAPSSPKTDLLKRRKTVSFDAETLKAESFVLETEHPTVTPPEDMEWLISAIAANGGSSLFNLDPAFLATYKDVDPPFGFNGLGQLVYMRTYSRIKADGTNERWVDTVKRVVEGIYEVQKAYCQNILKTTFDEAKAQTSAQDMFDRMFRMKFLPPGRGLWAMGTDIVRRKGLGAALNNCAFVSTEDLAAKPTTPFTFLMDACMLGVGVGFDTAGAGRVMVQAPAQPAQKHVVGDTREGWVESLRLLLAGYLSGGPELEFDYSAIRPAGIVLKTFGGVSSGPEPLIKLHEAIRKVLDANKGETITVTTIVDIMNLIGKCVVAGNVRRTAEIAFGSATNTEFLDLKNYEANPHRAEYGWTSNNSVFAPVGMDYKEASERVQKNGEPGFAWLPNMQAFSRMQGKPDYRDERVKGGNPCLEQSLESMELCCLVETFPNHNTDLDDFRRTLDMALLYAKTITLITVHWPETREVMYRNRRIGCSVSGIAQYLTQRGIHQLQHWLEEGYKHLAREDERLSRWLKIPLSVKLTSVKPSGTISLLAGATPGIHYPESRFYLRRVRMAKDFPMLDGLRKAGYVVEPAVGSEESTVVVEVPVDVGAGIRGVAEVSMWEQLSLAAFLQRHWADNQVSATVSFDPAEEGKHIAHALEYFQYMLKGVSFLPRHEWGAFPQMPYEAISEERYGKEVARITSLPQLAADTDDALPPRTKSHIFRATSQQDATTHKMEDAFCDGDRCDLVAMKLAAEKAKQAAAAEAQAQEASS